MLLTLFSFWHFRCENRWRAGAGCKVNFQETKSTKNIGFGNKFPSTAHLIGDIFNFIFSVVYRRKLQFFFNLFSYTNNKNYRIYHLCLAKTTSKLLR
jgi:hypothetical protein